MSAEHPTAHFMAAVVASSASPKASEANYGRPTAFAIGMMNRLVRFGKTTAFPLQQRPPMANGAPRVFRFAGQNPSVDELEKLSATAARRKAKPGKSAVCRTITWKSTARHWSNVWTTVLIGRPAMPDRQSLVDREGMEKYSRDTFARNKPYDQMVRELITATGSNKPGERTSTAK